MALDIRCNDESPPTSTIDVGPLLGRSLKRRRRRRVLMTCNGRKG